MESLQRRSGVFHTYDQAARYSRQSRLYRSQSRYSSGHTQRAARRPAPPHPGRAPRPVTRVRSRNCIKSTHRGDFQVGSDAARCRVRLDNEQVNAINCYDTIYSATYPPPPSALPPAAAAAAAAAAPRFRGICLRTNVSNYRGTRALIPRETAY
jgi:hypothetical protein